MSGKQDALKTIAALAHRHGLTQADITVALAMPPGEADKASGALTRFLAYFGGVLIFCGIGVFLHMQWDVMSSAARVFATLGIGFCLFTAGVTAARDERFTRAATPLLLLAALLEAGGIAVALREYSQGGDPRHGLLFIAGVMALQQGLMLIALRRELLLLTTMFFSIAAITTIFDLLKLDGTLASFLTGLLLLLAGRIVSRTSFIITAELSYFAGSIAALVALFDWLHDSSANILYLGATTGIMYASTLARSPALLGIGTAATISYIGWYSHRYFADTLGWPVLLIFMGGVLIGVSRFAIKLGRGYRKQA